MHCQQDSSEDDNDDDLHGHTKHITVGISDISTNDIDGHLNTQTDDENSSIIDEHEKKVYLRQSHSICIFAIYCFPYSCFSTYAYIYDMYLLRCQIFL